MRKMVRRGICLLALILLAAGLWCGLRQDAPETVPGSSAALGLMLLEQRNGIYVLAVTDGSPADRSGIQPGDYLLTLAGEQLVTLETLDALLSDGNGSLPLTLDRDGQELYLQLPVR